MKALIIGACNLDIFAHSFQDLVKQESLPGHIELGFGGVGRNICENLAHLDVSCSFVSLIGDDTFSKSLFDYMSRLSINMSCVRSVASESMSMYLAMLDQNLDMLYGINDMSLASKFEVSDIDNIEENGLEYDIIVLDTNVEPLIVDYVFSKYAHKCIAVDCISANKAQKLKSHLDKISILKCNVYEAESLCQRSLVSQQDKMDACLMLHKSGVKHVLITDGDQNVYYNIDDTIHVYSVEPLSNVVNATGAGDAFLSGYLYAYLNAFEDAKCIKIACECAKITLQSTKACTLQINQITKENI